MQDIPNDSATWLLNSAHRKTRGPPSLMLPLRSVLPSLLSHFELRASHGFVENEVQRVGLYKSDDAVKFIGSPDSRRSVPCKDSIIFYPCQASLQDKKIRIDGTRCRKERLAKTRI